MMSDERLNFQRVVKFYNYFFCLFKCLNFIITMEAAANAPIETFALTTQRGVPKIQFAGRLFRQQKKIPHSHSDGTKSFYYYLCCSTPKCLGRLTGYCVVLEEAFELWKLYLESWAEMAFGQSEVDRDHGVRNE